MAKPNKTKAHHSFLWNDASGMNAPNIQKAGKGRNEILDSQTKNLFPSFGFFRAGIIYSVAQNTFQIFVRRFACVGRHFPHRFLQVIWDQDGHIFHRCHKQIATDSFRHLLQLLVRRIRLLFQANP
jgi:hypothetical protein